MNERRRATAPAAVAPVDVPSYDPDYFRRHSFRNRRRVRAVLDHMRSGPVLDVGCNRGYFSQSILDAGMSDAIDGVEPSSERVAPAVLADPRFHLFPSSVTEFQPDRTYETVLYLAVHHHVLAHEGYLAAMDVWQKLLDHCKGTIFFETGQLLEGPRWYWQRALAKEFSSDEEHVGALAKAAGPRLRGVEIVVRSFIHGCPRWLVRFDLDGTTAPRTPQPAAMAGTQSLRTFRRSKGSQSQSLIEVAPQDSTTGGSVGSRDPNVYTAASYTLVQGPHDELSWHKQRLDDPFKDVREHHVAHQIDDEHFLRPVHAAAVLGAGVVFPYVNGTPLAQFVREHGVSPVLLETYFQLIDRAHELSATMGRLDFCPSERDQRRRVVDLVDLHPSNVLLVDGSSSSPFDLVVVDMEYYANENRARNLMHGLRLAVHMRPLSCRVAMRVVRWLPSLVVHYARWETKPLETRIIEGYGSRHRHAVRLVRSVVDSTLRGLPGYWQ